MKQYHEYVKEYPKTIIFMKSGSFYKVKGQSAYLLHELMGFHLYLSGGEFCTGCPITSMEKALTKIREEELNYVMVDSNTVDVYREFVPSRYDEFQQLFEKMDAEKEIEAANRQAISEDESYAKKVRNLMMKLLEQESVMQQLHQELKEYSIDELQEILSHCVRIMQHVMNYGFGNRKKATSLEPYSISMEDAIACIQEQPTKISEFVARLNAATREDGHKKLVVTQITNWLLQSGYLCEIYDEQDNRIRVASEQGQQIGIDTQEHQGQRGMYRCNTYDSNAQRFIIEHLEEILEVS